MFLGRGLNPGHKNKLITYYLLLITYYLLLITYYLLLITYYLLLITYYLIQPLLNKERVP